ncbi:hypothetical protein AB0G06_14515 [Nonomuraea dietziae]|uniref:hypothetical protein n=1 Tax=Nonomuraea dietziae TaxID=65515 RepID=UPI0033CD143D
MRKLMIPALALALAFIAAPAQADTSETLAVDVLVEDSGLNSPATVTAGATTFRIRSADPEGAYVGLVRIRPGLALHDVLADVERAFDHADREGALAAARRLSAEMVLYGGAAVQAGMVVEYTTVLAPGAYVVIGARDDWFDHGLATPGSDEIPSDPRDRTGSRHLLQTFSRTGCAGAPPVCGRCVADVWPPGYRRVAAVLASRES